jgi:DNA-binding phage protein
MFRNIPEGLSMLDKFSRLDPAEYLENEELRELFMNEALKLGDDSYIAKAEAIIERSRILHGEKPSGKGLPETNA